MDILHVVPLTEIQSSIYCSIYQYPYSPKDNKELIVTTMSNNKKVLITKLKYSNLEQHSSNKNNPFYKCLKK